MSFWQVPAIMYISSVSFLTAMILSLAESVFHSMTFLGLAIIPNFFLSRKYKHAVMSAFAFAFVYHGVPTLYNVSFSQLLVSTPGVPTVLSFYGSCLSDGILISFTNLVGLFVYNQINNQWNFKAMQNRREFFIWIFLFKTLIILPFIYKNPPKQIIDGRFNVLGVQPSWIDKNVNDISTSNNLKEKHKLFRDDVTDLIKDVDLSAIDLVVTPESGMPGLTGTPPHPSLETEWQINFSTQIQTQLRNFDTFYMGVYAKPVQNDSWTTAKMNVVPTTFVYDENGIMVDALPKSYLIPFAEYIPGLEQFPFLRHFFPWASSKVTKAQRVTVKIKGKTIAPMICYDGVFESMFERAMKEGADVAIVMSNSYAMGIDGARLQSTVTEALSAQYGLPILLISNSGPTGFNNRNLKPEWGNQFALKFDLSQTQSTPTFYSKYLAYIVPIASKFIVLILLCWLMWNIYRQLQIIRINKFLVQLLRSFTIQILIVGTLIYLSFERFFTVYKVNSISMLPSFQDTQSIVLCRNVSDLKRGDVIVFASPLAGKALLKRVIFLPGDKYQFQDRAPILNGQQILVSNLSDDLYETNDRSLSYRFVAKDMSQMWPDYDFSVPSQFYFVLGDNRSFSEDSRTYGFVSADQVIGKVCGNFNIRTNNQ
jgi:signal peptidase I